MKITLRFEIRPANGLVPESVMRAMIKVINIVTECGGFNINIGIDENE